MGLAAQAWIALLALMAEALCGYPARLHARLPHPVVWIGGLIAMLEKRWNHQRIPPAVRRTAGIALVAVLAAAAGGTGWIIMRLAGATGFGWVIVALCATIALAQRSLHDHVAAVAVALDAGDLIDARRAVARIVGRDTEAMGAEDVAIAAIESLAESFNDGVVAPAFWLVVGGLPGALIYKAMNTADSMVGHREPRYRAFGWAAARADDLLNLLPARLAGALLCLAGSGGWRVMWREAARHASPNAGWPEAAMAGALSVRLGGSVRYDGLVHDRPVFCASGAAPTAAHLRRGLSLYRRACLLLWLLVALVAFGAHFLFHGAKS